MLKSLGFVLLWLVGSIAAVAVAWAGVSVVDDGLVNPAPASLPLAVDDASPTIPTVGPMATPDRVEAQDPTPVSGDTAAAAPAENAVEPGPTITVAPPVTPPAAPASLTATSESASLRQETAGPASDGDVVTTPVASPAAVARPTEAPTAEPRPPATPTRSAPDGVPSPTPSTPANPTSVPTAAPAPPTPSATPTTVATSTPVPTATPSPTAAPTPTAVPTATTVPAGSTAQSLTFHLIGGSTAISFSPEGAAVLWAAPNPGFVVDVEPELPGVKVDFRSDTHRSRLDAWWADGPSHEIREEADG